MNAGEIADIFNISKPSISHHLDLLKQAKLVSTQRKGQFIVYSLDTTVLEEAAQWLFTLSFKKKEKEANDDERAGEGYTTAF